MTASEQPRMVHLAYNYEDGSWWAESAEMPSLFAGGESLDDAKELAKQAVRDEFGEDISVIDWMPAPAELEPIIASKGTGVQQGAFRGSGNAAQVPGHHWSAPAGAGSA